MSEQASIIEVDEAAEKARAANIRFKQQVFGTVGSAMLFGLVGVVVTKLLAPVVGGAAATAGASATTAAATTATAAGASSLLVPVLGIAAVAVIGLTCVYLAAKFISTSVSLDQDAQARKIEAAKLRAKGIEQPMPEVTISRPMGTPFGATHAADAGEKAPEATPPAPTVPSKTVSNIVSHEKIDKSAALLASHAAPEASWASRTAANDTAPATQTSVRS
jgi:hypothetical protein